MDFGKIPENELEQIDFALPPEPAGNKDVLKKGKGKTKFYIGCAKWGRKDWKASYTRKALRRKTSCITMPRSSTVLNSMAFFKATTRASRWRNG